MIFLYMNENEEKHRGRVTIETHRVESLRTVQNFLVARYRTPVHGALLLETLKSVQPMNFSHFTKSVFYARSEVLTAVLVIIATIL